MNDTEAKAWAAEWLRAVKEAFGEERIVCAGLQGSRGRGEASPESDIDLVLILDRAEAEDLLRYRAVLDALPERDKACGFVSGREELRCWERGEHFSFCRDTVPFLGSLDFAMELADREDVRRGALAGACAVYHGCVHNLLHERSGEALAALGKAAFFVLRDLYWLETGAFLTRRRELLPLLGREERELLEGPKEDLEAFSGRLLAWSSRVIRRLGAR